MSIKCFCNLLVIDYVVLCWLECYSFVDVEVVCEQIFKEIYEVLKSGVIKLLVNGIEYWMKDGVVVMLIDKCQICCLLKWLC